MKEITLMLKKSLNENFDEHIAQLGFNPERRRGDIFPYRRIREANNDLLEVQFDKYGRPRFVLNFGIVPVDGVIDAYGRFVEAKDVCIAQLVQHGRLYCLPYLPVWFRPNRLFGIRSPEYSVNKVMSHFILLFVQVECWFLTGASGSHLQICHDQWNYPGIRKQSMQQKGTWPPEGWTEEDQKSLRM